MRKWQKYEEHILTKLEEQFPDSEILSNQKMRGRYSKTKRQVDVLLRGKLAKWDMLGVVECKCFSRKINVKSVDQFIGMVNDIGGHVGVMFTNMGYSKSAIKRAENDPTTIRLELVDFPEVDNWKMDWLSVFGIVYSSIYRLRLNTDWSPDELAFEKDFFSWIDALTPGFHHALSSISQQQIRIVDIIAAIGKAVSPRFLSKSLDLDERVVLAQLKRLQKSGLIDVHHDGQKVMKVSTRTDFTLWHLFRTKRDIENIREETLRVLFNRDLVKPFH